MADITKLEGLRASGPGGLGLHGLSSPARLDMCSLYMAPGEMSCFTQTTISNNSLIKKAKLLGAISKTMMPQSKLLDTRAHTNHVVGD
jgi:hypothetical protein